VPTIVELKKAQGPGSERERKKERERSTKGLIYIFLNGHE
jgi:hypothetical protein